jgi:hypothetical protein
MKKKFTLSTLLGSISHLIGAAFSSSFVVVIDIWFWRVHAEIFATNFFFFFFCVLVFCRSSESAPLFLPVVACAVAHLVPAAHAMNTPLAWLHSCRQTLEQSLTLPELTQMLQRLWADGITSSPSPSELMCAPPGFPLPALNTGTHPLSSEVVSCLLAYTFICRALGSIAPVTATARAALLHLNSVCHRAMQSALRQGMYGSTGCSI